MKIHEGFAEIADRFDVLLVDAYGVFWDGGRFFPGSLEVMEEAVKKGRQVCILSNTTSLSADSVRSYEKKGMFAGRHYTDFVTSGDVFREAVLAEKLDIPGKNIYIWGTPRAALFADSAYRVVPDADEADAFYISIPQLTTEEKEAFPSLSGHFYLSRLTAEGESPLWDSLVTEPFKDSLLQMRQRGLPALCANPDYRAFEKPKDGGEPQPVVRQGTIAEMYRRMDGRVVEFGKPHANIYQYAFRKLGISPSGRVAMIGDTFRTDMAGALNAGISAVWCVETGMSRYEAEQGVSLERQAGSRLADVYMVKSFGGGYAARPELSALRSREGGCSR